MQLINNSTFKALLFLFFVILDFYTKKIVFNNVNLNSFIFINPFLDLTHIHNFGISFGLFNGVSAFFFIFLGILITLIVIYMYVKSQHNLEKLGLFLIISGAVSNILDRTINGYVIDFIFLHYKDFYWPAFNFADIYITIGILIIIFHYFNDMKNKK